MSKYHSQEIKSHLLDYGYEAELRLKNVPQRIEYRGIDFKFMARRFNEYLPSYIHDPYDTTDYDYPFFASARTVGRNTILWE